VTVGIEHRLRTLGDAVAHGETTINLKAGVLPGGELQTARNESNDSRL